MFNSSAVLPPKDLHTVVTQKLCNPRSFFPARAGGFTALGYVHTAVKQAMFNPRSFFPARAGVLTWVFSQLRKLRVTQFVYEYRGCVELNTLCLTQIGVPSINSIFHQIVEFEATTGLMETLEE